jgi:hypothetical protein
MEKFALHAGSDFEWVILTAAGFVGLVSFGVEKCGNVVVFSDGLGVDEVEV